MDTVSGNRSYSLNSNLKLLELSPSKSQVLVTGSTKEAVTYGYSNAKINNNTLLHAKSNNTFLGLLFTSTAEKSSLNPGQYIISTIASDYAVYNNSSSAANMDLATIFENVSSSPNDKVFFSDNVGFNFTEKVIIGVFLSIIIVCAVAGNLLVCLAIFTERNLRKPSNYFYVSLALADLLVATVVMTFAVANDIMGHWVFGYTFCNIWLSSDVMCSTASILNICAISLDRFLHIKDPYHYENTMTHRKTLLFIAILWILSALISFLPIHLGWHKTMDYNQYVGDKFICLLDLNPTYAVTSSIVSFYVPCVIMIAIYAKLYMLARRHVKNIKRNSTWSAISTAMLDPRHPAAAQHHYRPSDQKAAITLGFIMGTFLFCWTPFFAINVITALCSTCVPPLLFNIFTWLGYINSMANPIIYPVFNKEFRTAFKRILSCPDSQNVDQDCRHNKVIMCTNKSDKKNSQSSKYCHFCCIKLHYRSVQLNGHSANLASPEHEPSLTDPDGKITRRCSESPLINTHVDHNVIPESQLLKLDRVTVV